MARIGRELGVQLAAIAACTPASELGSLGMEILRRAGLKPSGEVAEPPPTLEGLIEVVAEATSIDPDWLDAFAGRVLRALDNVGCLAGLHGLRGRYEAPVPEPEWFYRFWREYSIRRDDRRVEVEVADWAKGTVSLVETRPGDAQPRRKTVRLGKWLAQAGATTEQLREFETRQLATWEWRISTSWVDVLTMSHNRPWTSCMRPGGKHELGPLSISYGGGAMLFWYRPGAGSPCGRQYLLPCVDRDGSPAIYLLPQVYGSGPVLKDYALQARIEAELGRELPPVRKMALDSVYSLSYDVYDDWTRGEWLGSDERPPWRTDEEIEDLLRQSHRGTWLSKEPKVIQDVREMAREVLKEESWRLPPERYQSGPVDDWDGRNEGLNDYYWEDWAEYLGY